MSDDLGTRRPGGRRLWRLFLCVAWIAHAEWVVAAKLLPDTLKAWERYVTWADQKVERELSGPNGFLIEDYLPRPERDAIRAEVRIGKVVVRKRTEVVPAGTTYSIPDGTIHHWWGVVLVRDVKLEQVLRFVKDYDHYAGRSAEVERSRLLSREGDTFRVYLRLRRTKPPITVYYNTEYETHYYTRGPGRVSTRSEATTIAELENPGTPRERELTNQEDWGFLWRYVTWWRYLETEDGVIVECESASLGRAVPTWLRFVPGLMAYIDSVPHESIVNTLSSIRTQTPSVR